MSRTCSQKGMTLVEVAFAMFIISVTMVGIAPLLIRASQISTESRCMVRATEAASREFAAIEEMAVDGNFDNIDGVYPQFPLTTTRVSPGTRNESYVDMNGVAGYQANADQLTGVWLQVTVDNDSAAVQENYRTHTAADLDAEQGASRESPYVQAWDTSTNDFSAAAATMLAGGAASTFFKRVTIVVSWLRRGGKNGQSTFVRYYTRQN